jgi:hypothetical protein
MKRSLWTLSLLFLLNSAYAKPDTSGVMTLLGTTLGHACPVDGQVLSAAHVAFDPRGYARQFSWEDDAGRAGTAKGLELNGYRDLAELTVTHGTPEYYKGGPPPEVGSEVTWVQYDDNLNRKIRSAKVLFYRAGYLFFHKPPQYGASGSCLFDEAGNAVGIVVWATGAHRNRGAAVVLDWP